MSSYAPIKIQHSPQTTYSPSTQLNFPGAQTVAGLRGTLPSFTDTNSIFVSKAGLDSNAGTQASPKLTLNGAMNAVKGSNFQYVVILDSGSYSEYMNTQFSPAQFPNFIGIYAADGAAPVFTLQRGAVYGTYGAGNPARVVVGTANYFISKNGNDATGQRNNSGLPFLTIQAALSDGARQTGDIFEVGDDNVYQENLNFGSLPSTLRAASGLIPTILYAGGLQMIGYTAASGSPTLDGFVLAGNGGYVYLYAGPTQNVTTGGVTFENCTISNWALLNGVYNNPAIDTPGTQTYYPANAYFANCIFSLVGSVIPVGGGVYITTQYFNCFFASPQSPGGYFGIGINVLQVVGCTFNNMIVTGSFGYDGEDAPGCHIGTMNVQGCFFQNSSLSIDYNHLASEQPNGTMGMPGNYEMDVSDCIFNQGYLSAVTNAPGAAPIALNIYILVKLSNLQIYAPGQTYGLQLWSEPGNGGSTVAIILGCNVRNVVVSAANTNISLQRTLYVSDTPYGFFLFNVTSLGASGTGLEVRGYGANLTAPTNFTVLGFIDSGSGSPFSIPAVSPGAYPLYYNSEPYAQVVSASSGSENGTLAASDPGNFTGGVNVNNGAVSMGYDHSLFDLSIPCVLNGLTFKGWSYPLLPTANMEGAIQSSAGALLNIKNCTFTVYGSYAIKASRGSIIENCLFFGCAGNAVESSAAHVTLKNNVAIGCGGAFFNNYGQGALVSHNTAYSCAYGEYDSAEVVIVSSDSNIFAGSGAYDYSGSAMMTYSCVGTLDIYTIASLDEFSTQVDPLFRNANAGDATLQAKAYAYFWDSPCIGGASDGSDMGAYQVIYGTPTTTWTLVDFSINDPATGAPWRNPDKMSRRIHSTKLAEGTQENGAIYSRAATYKLRYELTWNPASNDMPLGQMEALQTMFRSATNQIEVDFGDGRGWVPAFFLRESGFEYEDVTSSYADNAVPEPVQQIVIQEA